MRKKKRSIIVRVWESVSQPWPLPLLNRLMVNLRSELLNALMRRRKESNALRVGVIHELIHNKDKGNDEALLCLSVYRYVYVYL